MLNLQSKFTNQIIGYFFINPQKKLYLKQLAEALAVDGGNLSRKIKKLEIEGIISSDTEGRQKYFFLNKKYPFLAEVKRMHEAQFSLPILLKKALSAVSGLKEAYIFGSYAKKTFNSESDIDLLLIGGHDCFVAQRAILPIQKKIGREINIIDFSEAEYKKKKADGNDFLKNVFSGPLIKII